MVSTALAMLRRCGFKSGLANCHVPGLYSLVIADRVDSATGMLRIFYAGPDCTALTEFLKPTQDSFEFSVLPHNHRQSITLYRLFGNPMNWDIQAKDDGPAFEWEFGSALLEGEFSLKQKRSVQLDVMEKPIPVKGLTLGANAVHTVTADPVSAWLVDEHDLSGEANTNCYSLQPNVSLSSDGLYVPLCSAELQLLASTILIRSEVTP